MGEAPDACQGIQMARELSPDVVLVDLSLPDRDGIEVAAGLSQDRAHGVPVILTLHDTPANRAASSRLPKICGTAKRRAVLSAASRLMSNRPATGKFRRW